MIDNVHNLIRHELLVQRLEYRAHGGDAEEDLEVFGAVVHQGGDALIPVDAELIAKCMCQRTSARGNGGKSGGLGAVTVPGGHRSPTVNGATVFHNLSDIERNMRHRTAHELYSTDSQPRDLAKRR